MTVQAQCPSCSTTAGVDESFAGRRVRCRKCGERFQIDPALFGLPSVTSDSADSDQGGDDDGDSALAGFLNDLGADNAPRASATAAVAPAPAPRSQAPTPRPAPARPDPEPEPRAPQPLGVPLMFLALLILGGAIAFFVWIDQVQREHRTSATKTPAAPAPADSKPAPKP